MIPGIKAKVQEDINEQGHPQEDNRLNRHTRSINGYELQHHYFEDIKKTPDIKDKYKEDWKRMYSSYVQACEELVRDPMSRRAVIFNTSKYDENYQCFLLFQLLSREPGKYDCVVFQRSADLEKLEDDVAFFEYVMHKISKRAGINVDRLIIHYGSIHYETQE